MLPQEQLERLCGFKVTRGLLACFRRPAERGEGGDESSGDGRVLAPMPGRVVLVKATAGQAVAAGAELLVMEAMKMELALKAPRAGIIAELRVREGDFVEADAVLVRLEA